MKKNLTLDEMIRYAQESAADGGYVEVPGAELLPLLLELVAARTFITRARSLAMDMYDIGHCPICDCAEDHTGDCTFARSEEALNAYVKVVQK